MSSQQHKMAQDTRDICGAVGDATFVNGADFAITTTTTYGIYTIEDIVTALKAQGYLP